jgi:ADP-ribosylglycohydrolase
VIDDFGVWLRLFLSRHRRASATTIAIALPGGGALSRASVRAVNDSCDNDTIAAIVGAAVGALHGEAALPKRWRDNLLGRTMEADDGRVFDLLDAVEVFLP